MHVASVIAVETFKKLLFFLSGNMHDNIHIQPHIKKHDGR